MPEDGQLRLAILYDDNSPYSPSNLPAIQQFCRTAGEFGITTEIITQKDIHRLSDFSALFIRDTTHPAHYTYEFAIEAAARGLKVLDSPESIMKGCNKIWQVQAFSSYNIPYPETWIINWNNSDKMVDFVTFPCVLKVPDSCFSQGVYLAKDKSQFRRLISQLFNRGTNCTQKLVCQEFIETRFDWRIALFERKLLFACKYYMVDKDWKIIKYDRKGNYVDGKHESVPLDQIPERVKDAALACVTILDDGLYGIDIKETEDNVYVIEINDNPSIDAGVEDENYGTAIYESIIRWYKGNT